mgnify:FL=1
MPQPPTEKLTGQEDGEISALIQSRAVFLAHTQRLTEALTLVRLTLASRSACLELIEAYHAAVTSRVSDIALVRAKLQAAYPPGPPQ